MASMEEKYDNALIGILQNEGQIAKFLDVLLGFLYRRTDFYRIMKSEQDKLGFPPGVAMKLLMNIFKKYENLAAQDEVKRQKLLQQRAAQAQPSPSPSPHEGEKERASSSSGTPPAAPPPTQSQPAPPTSEAPPPPTPDTRPPSQAPPAAGSEKPREAEEGKKEPTPQPAEGGGGGGGGVKEDQGTGGAAGEKAMEVDADAKPKDEDEEQEKLQKKFQANPESYNGAVRDNYSWSQSITDADVRVNVPKTVVKGKDVKVDIAKKRLCVRYRGSEGGIVDGVEGELTWEVRPEECMWTLSPGQHVHINLEKKEERWWEGIFVNEPKINTRKIDCSRPMTDLDDEAQAKIEEMMFNERQKRLGLPQSHEQKQIEMLRQAWNAEGSPFKGQPFDPSAISVDPSGMIKMK